MHDRVAKHRRALLDTSVVIDLELVDPTKLPDEPLISTITLAELAAGPQATDDPAERGRRQDRLQRAEAAFAPLPFDEGAARAYGRVYAQVAAAGRKPRGARAFDLMIAAVALNGDLPLYTRNPADFQALNELIEIADV
jgi:predicted nucleic acid-binding protein